MEMIKLFVVMLVVMMMAVATVTASDGPAPGPVSDATTVFVPTAIASLSAIAGRGNGRGIREPKINPEMITIIRLEVEVEAWGKKQVKVYDSSFIPSHALPEDVSPKDNDANTRALLAPLWNFLLLLTFSLLNADFTSNSWRACVKTCLLSPKIARFNRGMYATHNAITLDTTSGHKIRNAFSNTNDKENTRYGSSLIMSFHETTLLGLFSEDGIT
ncbi:hypothetical protein Ccrd_013302 [Cynara cardunculus var. scolymus]|uniref:Uncharacterized protein n=1 Tax=Cynara cardunculus var. scolymus TaxID=59895 RepID=A0A118K501_CYNCS|nr:hypothetical protein Ccrd_013302 [Cynara cardunculus var. scolymus]